MADKKVILPQNFEPRDYQLEFLKADKRFSVLVFHRRSGKSKTAFNRQLIKAIKKKGLYYYFLPTYKQAKSVVWETFIQEHIPKEIIRSKNNTELTVELINGSILHYAGCEDIDRHRGINPIDVVFDEFSEMNPEIWTAIIQPILRENKGSATFIFTPKGKNHSWELYVKAKELEDWFTSLKTVYDTNALPPEEIEKAKQETPLALYKQEYECDFMEDASSVFRRIDENTREYRTYPESGKRYQIGVDLARLNDYTAISVCDLHTLNTEIIERFNQIDWSLQMAKIEAIARRYNNADIWLDSTGVGDPIYEDLRNRGLTIKEFKFNERSREQLLNNLAILLEHDKIKLKRNDILDTELKSFKWELSGNKVKARVPDSYHDDTVMALALSVWGIDKPLPLDEYNEDVVTVEVQTYT